LEECGPCPVFAGFTLAFALQLRKIPGKTAFRTAEECQLARLNINTVIIKKILSPSFKEQLFYFDFNQISISPTNFHRRPQYQIGIRADTCEDMEGQTDRKGDGHI